jgi:hypothetical protein
VCWNLYPERPARSVVTLPTALSRLLESEEIIFSFIFGMDKKYYSNLYAIFLFIFESLQVFTLFCRISWFIVLLKVALIKASLHGAESFLRS